MTPNPNPSPELKPCPFCGGEGEAVCLRAGEDSVLSWVRCLSCHAKTDEIEDAYSDLPTARANWNTRALSQTLPAPGEVEPFGYWIEQRLAEPVLLRKPSYIPEPSELRTVTPLYAAPTLATVAAANDEGVADYPDELLDLVAEAITRAQCPGREGPYGGYDYGHRHEDDLPRDGRYVVRDFRDVRSDTFGAWVHQTPDVEVHEAAFDRLTKRHIARAALDVAAIRLLPQGGGK